MTDRSLKQKIEDAREDKRQRQAALKKQTELHAPRGAKKAFQHLKDVLRKLIDASAKRIAVLRKRKQAKHDDARKKAVDYCVWGVANEPAIHYRQSRPIDGLDRSPKDQKSTPLYTDCSGFVTKACKYAGIPDPNGFGFNGYGYTGSQYQHLPHIPRSAARPGDLVEFGGFPGSHVVMLVEAGTKGDPMVVSHGQEAGPLRVPLSVQIAAHPGQAVTFLKTLND